MSRFLIHTGHVANRMSVGHVAHDILRGEVPSVPIEDVIGVNTALDPAEYKTAGILYDTPFGVGDSFSPIPIRLNLQYVEQGASGIPAAKWCPLDIADIGDGRPDNGPVCSLLNVKTWKVTGSIYGVQQSATAYAGTAGSIGDPGTRPHDGKRDRYGFSCNIDHTAGDVRLTVSITVSGSVYRWAEPVAGCLCPDISGRISGTREIDESTSESAQYNIAGGLFGVDEGTVNPEATFLGIEMRMADVIGTPTTYSLAIEAEEFWQPEDFWRTS